MENLITMGAALIVGLALVIVIGKFF